MEKVLAILKVLRLVMPVLRDLILSAEQALPEAGNGRAKLEMVRGWVDALIRTDSQLQAGVDGAWPLIEGAVGVMVKTYNGTGLLGTVAAKAGAAP